jgi:prolyl-tRNA synthetase
VRSSQLFTKTRKEAPADEVSKNAQLLIRAGYVYKVMAGVYAYTPLGIKVIENIKTVVRQEMDAIGGQELIMTALQRRDTWEQTGRWDDKVVDVWFKTQLKDDTQIGLAWSHEEAIIEMMKQHVTSYKDLPANVYQFQTKFRNELRSKSGIMRGREFVMKDMYSCSIDAAQHEAFYNQTIEAYKRVFDRLGIGTDTYVTYASGGAFTKFSHEFQTICDAGEDVIYLHRGKNIAVNEEVMDDEALANLGVKRDELEKVKTAEVGNIFNFGTQKSQEMDFGFTNDAGAKQFVHLGSYGIGITRVMGVLVEKLSDDKGIVWPANVAPFVVYLVRLGDQPEVVAACDDVYKQLQDKGITVLYDDRDARAGEKFADADLMGMPFRIVCSAKTLAASTFECTERSNGQTKMLDLKQLISLVQT